MSDTTKNTAAAFMLPLCKIKSVDDVCERIRAEFREFLKTMRGDDERTVALAEFIEIIGDEDVRFNANMRRLPRGSGAVQLTISYWLWKDENYVQGICTRTSYHFDTSKNGFDFVKRVFERTCKMAMRQYHEKFSDNLIEPLREPLNDRGNAPRLRGRLPMDNRWLTDELNDSVGADTSVSADVAMAAIATTQHTSFCEIFYEDRRYELHVALAWIDKSQRDTFRSDGVLPFQSDVNAAAYAVSGEANDDGYYLATAICDSVDDAVALYNRVDWKALIKSHCKNNRKKRFTDFDVRYHLLINPKGEKNER